jgi:small subunit ribosomal protein S3
VGQKVNPIGFRVGVYRDWDAKWFPRDGRKGSYAKELLEDLKIRKYLDKTLETAEVSRVEIEKTGNAVRIIIHTSRPGLVIGKKGPPGEYLLLDMKVIVEFGFLSIDFVGNGIPFLRGNNSGNI